MTTEQRKSKTLTIREAARLAGTQEQYIRKLRKTGKIKSTMAVVPGTRIPRWNLDRESFESYFSEKRTRTRRTDGRNKYTVYLTTSEYEVLSKLLKDNKLEVPLGRANPPKKKPQESPAAA